MFDIIAELLELILGGGGISGFDSLEAQRRARIVSAVVALGAILVGYYILGSWIGVVISIGGLIVALWVLAFSLVDLAKERPDVPWASVAAILVAGASVATAVGIAILGR